MSDRYPWDVDYDFVRDGLGITEFGSSVQSMDRGPHCYICARPAHGGIGRLGHGVTRWFCDNEEHRKLVVAMGAD